MLTGNAPPRHTVTKTESPYAWATCLLLSGYSAYSSHATRAGLAGIRYKVILSFRLSYFLPPIPETFFKSSGLNNLFVFLNSTVSEG